MNPFIFCATTNTRKFTLDKLQYCVSHFANIKKIIYHPTCNFDYAFVHINEWKENSSSLIESIYYHKEANINMNRNGNYWIFTPIENYPNNYITFNKNEYENKHMLRELLH